MSSGRGADAAEHWAQGQFNLSGLEVRRVYPRHAHFLVQLPDESLRFAQPFGAQESRIGGIRSKQRSRISGGTIGFETNQMHHQRVARLSSFDEKRTRLGIRALSALDAGRVVSTSIDGG